MATDPIRWLVDLPRSERDGRRLRVDVFERTPGRDGLSTGWRPVSSARQSLERAFVRSGGVRALASLARTGRCDVIVEHGQPAQQLAVDEGGPFRFMVVVDQGPSRPGGAAGWPDLLVRGELHRAGDVLPVDRVTAIFDNGVAFVGPRALGVELGADVEWVIALRERREVAIAAGDAAAFLRDLLATCGEGSITLPNGLRVERDIPFRTHVRVQRPATVGERACVRTFDADVTFDYGGPTAAWRERGRVTLEESGRRVVARNAGGEQRAIAELLSAGFACVRSPRGERQLRIASARLAAAVLALPCERFVVAAEGIVHRRAGAPRVSVSSGIGGFELSARVSFDGVEPSGPALLAAAQRKDTLVCLGDGSVGVLPGDWIARLSRLVALAGADARTTTEPGLSLRFSRSQLVMVDTILDGDRVEWDVPLASLRAHLARAAKLPLAATPRRFEGELRAYQRAGLAWLQWLEGIGFSGCLADDTGLGKTVQVLALLADRTERRRVEGPSLVVAPRSVVHVWLGEARRFTPSLRVVELHSTTSTDEARGADLLVTTYGVVRQGSRALGALSLDHVVLDEAHAMATAEGATIHGVRQLRSRHRVALTGTPVEHCLGELASLFDLLNPGMLGPAVRASSARSLELEPEDAARLGRALRPFILRREKREVLPDLLPRVEEVELLLTGRDRASQLGSAAPVRPRRPSQRPKKPVGTKVASEPVETFRRGTQ